MCPDGSRAGDCLLRSCIVPSPRDFEEVHLRIERRSVLVVIVLGAGLASAALLPAMRRPAGATSSGALLAPPFQQSAAALADTSFGRLIARISEPGGWFDTDNLISNESSYLHIMGRLRALGIRGGAYIGVGPDQNFSYIAQIRPSLAFILDIRRDNLLEHLLFKALLELAPTRIGYLSLLFGRSPPDDAARFRDATVDVLVTTIDRATKQQRLFDAAADRVAAAAAGFGVALTQDDLDTIRRFHGEFFAAGPDLRFTSFGRAPRPYYPTFRQLLLERDRDGRQANWLASEASYAFLRTMQLENRIVPVVGNFAGPHALHEIGRVLRERNERVTVLYASNVEFYLMQDRIFDRFADNVAALPFDRNAVIIRSVFGSVFGHPQSVPGYASTQLLQFMAAFVERHREGAYPTYGDLVYLDYIR